MAKKKAVVLREFIFTGSVGIEGRPIYRAGVYKEKTEGKCSCWGVL